MGYENKKEVVTMADLRMSNEFEYSRCPKCGVAVDFAHCMCYSNMNINHEIPKEKKSVGTLTIDIDCTEALIGLKAITREAKKATAALKELEEQQSKVVVTNNTTVSSESDVQKIAQEIYKGIQKDSRIRGY